MQCGTPPQFADGPWSQKGLGLLLQYISTPMQAYERRTSQRGLRCRVTHSALSAGTKPAGSWVPTDGRHRPCCLNWPCCTLYGMESPGRRLMLWGALGRPAGHPARGHDQVLDCRMPHGLGSLCPHYLTATTTGGEPACSCMTDTWEEKRKPLPTISTCVIVYIS
jgi:hypothetical protein